MSIAKSEFCRRFGRFITHRDDVKGSEYSNWSAAIDQGVHVTNDVSASNASISNDSSNKNSQQSTGRSRRLFNDALGFRV